MRKTREDQPVLSIGSTGGLTADDNFDDMSGGIEEEELADDEGLDQHDRTRRNDCQQTDDIHDSNDIEDDIAGTGERPPKATHSGR